MTDLAVVNINENQVVISPADNTPDRITVTDNTTSEVTVLEQVTNVTVHGDSPTLTVQYGGTRGPIYAPGMDFDRNAILAYLIAGIERSHLNQVLNDEIDDSTTGLASARVDLEALFEKSGTLETGIEYLNTSVSQTQQEISSLAQRVTATENGDIEALQTQITQSADDLTLAAARLDSAEGNISTAQIALDAQAIRMTVAEESITSQVTQLSNEHTVKIQEDLGDGTFYMVGAGMALVADWKEGKPVEEGEFCWYDDETYECNTAHTTGSTFDASKWDLVPGGVKSQFGIQVDQFYIKAAGGSKKLAFTIQDGNTYINGDLIATGMISAAMMSTTDFFTVNFKSSTWSNPSLPGWNFDSTTGVATLRGMVIDFEELQNKPTITSLGGETPAGAQAKANAAQSTAISTASSDATTKANAAQNAAQSYAANLDFAALINGNTTKIDYNSIYTPNLAALKAALGTVTSGKAQSANNRRYMNLDATGSSYFLLCQTDAGTTKFYVKADGTAYFDGTLAANIITASQIVAGSITSTEVNSTAGLSGNKLGTITGTILVGGNNNATVSHGLGRYVIAQIDNSNNCNIYYISTSSFKISNNSSSNITVRYAYI